LRGRLNNKITVYGIWVAEDSMCCSRHRDSSPEECRKIGHSTSKVPTTAFKNPFL